VRRLSTVVRCAAAIVLLAIAWIDGAGLEFQARAMACCAHRKHCGGGSVSAPDKCCERMGHAAPAKTGTIVQTSHVVALVPTVFAPAPIVESASIPHCRDFVRPHDPPHLHAFALLI
jgi:hypothetical protein